MTEVQEWWQDRVLLGLPPRTRARYSAAQAVLGGDLLTLVFPNDVHRERAAEHLPLVQEQVDAATPEGCPRRLAYLVTATRQPQGRGQR